MLARSIGFCSFSDGDLLRGVKNYITQILSKLEMRDRIAAALWAKENL